MPERHLVHFLFRINHWRNWHKKLENCQKLKISDIFTREGESRRKILKTFHLEDTELKQNRNVFSRRFLKSDTSTNLACQLRVRFFFTSEGVFVLHRVNGRARTILERRASGPELIQQLAKVTRVLKLFRQNWKFPADKENCHSESQVRRHSRSNCDESLQPVKKEHHHYMLSGWEDSSEWQRYIYQFQ